jgi:hypothetical protein
MPQQQISTEQIADGTVVASDIADGSITAVKIASVSNTAITGTITNSQIADVANTKITGIITASQLGTTSQPQFGSLGVGSAASGVNGEIRAANNITAYYSSDARLKENIKDVENALEKILEIGTKTFDWTDEYINSHGGLDGYFIQKSDFGVIAQDVQKVFPQAVRTRQDGTLAVDYEKLSTLSFQAIKELLKRIEALENK